jgi:hypothetical protein
LRDAYLRGADRPREAVPPEPPEPSVFPAPLAKVGLHDAEMALLDR